MSQDRSGIGIRRATVTWFAVISGRPGLGTPGSYHVVGRLYRRRAVPQAPPRVAQRARTLVPGAGGAVRSMWSSSWVAVAPHAAGSRWVHQHGRAPPGAG